MYQPLALWEYVASTFNFRIGWIRIRRLYFSIYLLQSNFSILLYTILIRCLCYVEKCSYFHIHIICNYFQWEGDRCSFGVLILVSRTELRQQLYSVNHLYWFAMICWRYWYSINTSLLPLLSLKQLREPHRRQVEGDSNFSFMIGKQRM